MLTERRIRDAIPGSRSRVLWDDQVTGLGVRITPAGTKSYVLDYRVHGRRHRVTLARTAESSLKGMRDRAGAELVQIRAGTGDPLTRRREAAAQSTVAEGLDRFFTTFVPARRAAGRLAPRTEQTYRNQARRLLRPVLGRHRVADVTRRDIERMVAPLAPITRNRTLAFTSRLFTLFEHWDWRPHHTNPCRGVERAREEPRDRVLSPSDLAALGAALAAREPTCPPAACAIRVAALTGLRIGEVLAMRWADLAVETGTVTLPRTKTGRRTQALPRVVCDLLADVPRLHASDYVFTLTGRAAVTYKTVRSFFAACAVAAGLHDTDGTPTVRLHDLRRTVMTNAAVDGVGVHVLRDLLGHKTTAMADRYIRRTGSALREATERSGASMAAMLAGGRADGEESRG